MSAEEKMQFDKMAKEFAFIKRWLPVISFLGVIVGMAISGTRWFDKNVATKPDLAELRKDFKDFSSQITAAINKQDTGNQVAIRQVSVISNRRVDSLGKVVILIQKKVNGHFVTELYINGRNHDPQLIPATH